MKKIIIVILFLIVVSFVGIIVWRAITDAKTDITTSQQRAKDQIKRVEDNDEAARQKLPLLETIKSALDNYHQDNGVYPQELGLLVPNYLTEVPVDPVTGKDFTYVARENGIKYTLTAELANGSTYQINWPD